MSSASLDLLGLHFFFLVTGIKISRFKRLKRNGKGNLLSHVSFAKVCNIVSPRESCGYLYSRWDDIHTFAYHLIEDYYSKQNFEELTPDRKHY